MSQCNADRNPRLSTACATLRQFWRPRNGCSGRWRSRKAS